MELKRNLIDCAVIKVETTKNSPSYNNGNMLNSGISYSVPVKDIEETIKFIEVAYKELNMPLYRIYLSGFALLTENSISTKQRIVESIQREANLLTNEVSKAYIK